jgi:hypothetical protein
MNARVKPPSGALLSKDKLLAWVEDYAEREGLDAQRTLFLAKFASFASAAMESWAKVDTLMRLARCSERMVQKMREEFVAAGVLEATGRFHTLEDTRRKTPLYRWKLFLDEATGAEFGGVCGPGASGAPGAPEPDARVHGTAPSGAQGVHPQIEPREPNSPSGEGEARARQREALLVRLEAAAPRASLGNTIRDHVRAALDDVLDGDELEAGVDGEALVAAARAWAADPTFKRKDLGLQFWLRDRRFRRWLPEAADGAGEAGPAELAPGLLPAGEVGPWVRTMADVQARISAAAFGSYLAQASLGQIGEDLYLVTATRVARDWVRENCWAVVRERWAAADELGRELRLVSRSEFEAQMRQRGEG